MLKTFSSLGGTRFLAASATGLAVTCMSAIAVAQSVHPCPDPNQCVQMNITNGTGLPGGRVSTTLSFQQGPDDHQPGGIDAISAFALTLSLGDGTGIPLALADCTLGANGMPNAIHPDPSLEDFSVGVQNATCSAGRTHCLCPNAGSGIAPDNFINLLGIGHFPVVGGTFATVPNGPLITIDLTIDRTASATIPLHVFTEWSDSDHPPFTAFLSIGDVLSTDQTCVPSMDPFPCAPGAVSQVAVIDGSVGITSPTPTGTPTSSPTATSMPTQTPTVTVKIVTSTPTASPTATPTPTEAARSVGGGGCRLDPHQSDRRATGTLALLAILLVVSRTRREIEGRRVQTSRLRTTRRPNNRLQVTAAVQPQALAAAAPEPGRSA